MPERIKPSYLVGYKKPPRHSQFQKGCSGNPGGRKKQSANIYDIVGGALRKRVVVTEHGRRRQIEKEEAVAMQLVISAAKGELRALRLLFDILQSDDCKDIPEEIFIYVDEADLNA